MSSMTASLAHAAAPDSDMSANQRRAPRVLVDLASRVQARGCIHDIRVINISSLGLMCRTDAELLIGERLSVWLPVIKNVSAEVRWAEDGRIGMEFRAPIQPHIYEAMLALIPPRQTAW